MLRSAIALCAGIACLVMTAPAAAQTVEVIPTERSFRVNGVHVQTMQPAVWPWKPPIVMVHGGAHGAWSFQHYSFDFALLHEYYACALDWLNHGASDPLPPTTFLNRSIVDVAHREIRDVVNRVGIPILIGHSMGALAALAYAANYPVSRLVLIAPVLPSSIGAPPINIPVDLTRPFEPFPFEVARQLFYPTLDLAAAQEAHSRLVAESPRAVWEATRWTVDINLDAILAPTFVIAAELDPLTPADWVQVLANRLDAQYHLEPGVGHSDLLLKPGTSTDVVERIATWLNF